MFRLDKDKGFDKKLEKLLRKNPELKSRVAKTLKQLKHNPKHPGLRSHQIND